VSYTKEEMARLDAEIARVAAFQKVSAERVANVMSEWRRQEAKLEAERVAKLDASRQHWDQRDARHRATLAKKEAKTIEMKHRERRSRIKWAEVIDDPTVVDAQIVWERITTAWAMREAGLKFREIGERMGVSVERARQMHYRGVRFRNQPWRRSPAERHMNAENTSGVVPRTKRDAWRMLQMMTPIAPRSDEDSWIWMGLAA
jgi:hypothetical protein